MALHMKQNYTSWYAVDFTRKGTAVALNSVKDIKSDVYY